MKTRVYARSETMGQSAMPPLGTLHDMSRKDIPGDDDPLNELSGIERYVFIQNESSHGVSSLDVHFPQQ